MRNLFIIIVIMLYSCSPSLNTKKQEIYTYVSQECKYKLELKLDRNFIYSYNCLGVSKSTIGKWDLKKDTVFFRIIKPVKVEELLSSQYLADMPNYGILKGNNTIIINKVKLKSK